MQFFASLPEERGRHCSVKHKIKVHTGHAYA